MPLQVVDVNAAAAVCIPVQLENLPVDTGFFGIEDGTVHFEQGRFIVLVLLAFNGIGCADEAFKPQALEVLDKEAGKITPLRVIARKKHRLVSESVRIVLQIGIDLLLDVGILSIKLIILGSLRGTKITVISHKLRSYGICRLIRTGWPGHKKGRRLNHLRPEALGSP